MKNRGKATNTELPNHDHDRKRGAEPIHTPKDERHPEDYKAVRILMLAARYISGLCEFRQVRKFEWAIPHNVDIFYDLKEWSSITYLYHYLKRLRSAKTELDASGDSEALHWVSRFLHNVVLDLDNDFLDAREIDKAVGGKVANDILNMVHGIPYLLKVELTEQAPKDKEM